MNNIVEDAIEQSWRDFSEDTPTFFMGSPSVCRKSHDHGWKEGYEWALIELEINKKIPKGVLKKYMSKINE